jgi:hypothetical protein
VKVLLLSEVKATLSEIAAIGPRASVNEDTVRRSLRDVGRRATRK